MADHLHIVIRTPHEVVVDERVAAARVPTGSGQAGLRPKQEPIMLVVEPGLIILRRDATLTLVATAGGLLEGDRETCILYTPFAVTGDRQEQLMAALESVLTTPGSELAARRRLGELEQRILQELRSRPNAARAGRTYG